MYGQKKINFIAADGLEITADLYVTNKNAPFIILLHQSGASRGEYTNIAPRLLNLKYNCMAVDLRAGAKYNYVVNETAKKAKEMGFPAETTDARLDIRAAIDYIYRNYEKPVILFGSSYSASLALLEAKKNFKVSAVVAFSPGEYFRPALILKQSLEDFGKPVFIAASNMESIYTKKLADALPTATTTFFTPVNHKGEHGAKALWPNSNASGEYWFELLLFFKGLEKY